MSAQEHVPLPSRSDNIDLVRAFYAKKILEQSQMKYAEPRAGGPYGLLSESTLPATELAGIHIPGTVDSWLEHAEKVPPDTGVEAISYREAAPKRPEGSSEFTIGILGAGVAGLYTALMIDSLGPDSGITYQILEADERIGGRLFTYQFEGYAADDYYDVGAMRFPQIPPQQRTFDLFNYLDLSKKVIPYIMSNDEEDILYFNGVSMTVDEYNISPNLDPFATGSGIDPKAAEAQFKTAIYPFKQALKANFEEGWEMLMNEDKHSMRTYLTFEKNFSGPMISWLETFDNSTASFDRAFAENVMDSFIFDYEEDVKWSTLHGGSKVLVDAILAKIQTQPEIGKRVTALSINLQDPREQLQVTVTVDQEAQSRVYDHVVSTLPFGCLRLVDTRGCQMPFNLRQAIQSLQYGPSVKVAMRFSTRWWETDQKTRGGVSRTDCPTRIVVYPSYGAGTNAATILVSYTWTQDASRTAAFVKGSEADKVLLDSILSDLAQMHDVDYQWLQDQYEDHHAWSWDNSEFSAGAFALFGPGQFQNMYPEITKPLHGALHFAGEACSVYHAWVVGALDTAYNALLQILVLRGRVDLVKRLKELWKGKELSDDDESLAIKQVVIGEMELARRQRGGLSS